MTFSGLLRTQPAYRMGTQTVRFNYYYLLLTICATFLCIIFLYGYSGSKTSYNSYALSKICEHPSYNAVYPLTRPSADPSDRTAFSYRIALVADLDTKSKFMKSDGSFMWRSYIKYGHVVYAPKTQKLLIEFDDDIVPTILESGYSLKGRGMELSELVTFNGRLLTFDDRTGIVFELIGNNLVPWVILVDGNGRGSKGYKSEWATVKDETLYVGSMGKEWTTSSGVYSNNNPMYVKVINTSGEVCTIDWSVRYKALRAESMKIVWPGYMIHESGAWSDLHQRWFFLPRRCSKERYNETSDELMGCNVLISADNNFTKIKAIVLDFVDLHTPLGFSSFKFLPNTNNRIIVALLSSELEGKTNTHIVAFDIEGKTIYPRTQISNDYKYEGIEFV